MEETGSAPVPGRASRRPLVAGSVSLAVHSGLVLLALMVAGVRVVTQPEVALTPIEVIEPPPPPVEPPPPPQPAEPGTQVRSSANTSLGTLGRHGHDAPQRSQTHAPPVADPFADLVVSYETQTGPDPGNEAGTIGVGLGWGMFGDGTGGGAGGQFGLGNVPPAPPPSQARPPRPKADYRKWDFRAAPVFAGATVRFELSIDPGGTVRQVRILKGVDDYVDRHAAELARRFKFYPALNDAGQPTWGIHRWEFVLQGDESMESQFGHR